MAIEYCKTFQGRAGPTPTDYAFCKLRLPVTDVPIVPVLMGCETEVLVPGQPVVVAGFGDSSRLGGFGLKRWVETSIVKVGGPRGIQVGGMGKAPCFGDSGGPAFVTLPDGSWRVFGIDSAGIAQGCDAGDVMALMDDAVPWIEEQSGIDVTPCHDADGTWNPSSACRNFSMAPHAEGRTWTSGCAEAALSPPLASCGAPYEPTDGGAGDASSTDARKGFPLHADGGGVPSADDTDAFRPRVHSQACAVGGGGAAWPWLVVLAIFLRRLWA
jgi:hypothetical protein